VNEGVTGTILASPWIVPETSFGGSVAKRRDVAVVEARVGVTSVSLRSERRRGKETALAKFFYPSQILKQKCRYKVLTLKGVPLVSLVDEDGKKCKNTLSILNTTFDVKCGICTPYSDRNLLGYIPSVILLIVD
jgi:hypothetical protein